MASPSDLLLGKALRDDPVRFAKVLWPDVELYDKQRQILYSVRDNAETFVSAGHMLGKDFISGITVLWFFLTRHPVRIVTTSADYSQLESVLWGEIRRFVQTSRVPLEAAKGGPLVVNHLHLRKMVRLRGASGVPDLDGLVSPSRRDAADRLVVDGVSYCIGRVAARGEGMQGHHVTPTSGTAGAAATAGRADPVSAQGAGGLGTTLRDYDDGIPRTLFVADEASGVDDLSYAAATTWAKRMLVIGNPYPPSLGCSFFKKAVQEGDRRVKEEDE